MKKLLVGLTGGIACGKTVVSKQFKKLGADVIDADKVAWDIYKPGKSAWKKIVSYFGREILINNKINRRLLGQVVFKDKSKLKKLNKITHPEIIREINKRISKSKCNIMIIEAPLLFESGFDKLMDKTITVYAGKQQQVKRLIKRNGLKAEEALLRINLQMPLNKKKKLSDYTVNNSGKLAETRAQVNKIYSYLTKKS